MDKYEEKKNEILQNLLEDEAGERVRNVCDNNKEDWTTMAQEDMLDWIEEQGIYIRQ